MVSIFLPAGDGGTSDITLALNYIKLLHVTLLSLRRLAERTARAAGRILLKKFGHATIAVQKGAHDFATDADLASEQFIIAMLRRATPDIPILAEEGSGGATDWRRGRVWVVDPLDGTKNFAAGLPMWCVSIALVEDGIPIVGVVYAPVTRDLCAAHAGGGAFRNGQPITASRQTNFAESFLLVELPRKHEHTLRAFSTLLQHSVGLLTACRRIRTYGAAAYELALIAAGVADGYFDASGNTKVWDVAAGEVLVREAGGEIVVMTKYDQKNPTRRAVVAGNPAIVRRLTAK